MQEKKNKLDVVGTLLLVLLVMASVIVLFNSVKIFGLTANVVGNVRTTVSIADSEIFPKGVPEIYGKEIGVSFDDVSPSNPQLADITIRKLANYDLSIQLEGKAQERYLKIGSSIACEVCCGARALIFSNGQPACGCAHSYALRGLAKYLLQNHPEMTDEQILAELGKWKVLFFPDFHKQKAAILKSKGIELNYINLASNKYRGIEKGVKGGTMVGGC